MQQSITQQIIALLDISQRIPARRLKSPLRRSPAGPECYCACVNSRSRGRHSYISYYIHHCTIQVTHTFQQLLKNLDFTRHPIDTRQCSTTALALIYLTLFSMGFKYFALFISFQKILYLFVRRA